MRSRRLAVALLLLAAGGCTADTPAGTVGPTARPEAALVIGVDLPFSSLATDVSDDTWKAMSLYLDRVGRRAGKYTVELVKYDNAPPPNSVWDDTECRRNAVQHVANQREVAVIGTTFAACTKVQVPILNAAPIGPMLLVSHTETNPGLTRAWEVGEPDTYAPRGQRSFARVLPTGDRQGTAAARFAAEDLHVRSCFVLHDGQTYGVGVAKAFTEEARRRGIQIVGNAQWRPEAGNQLSVWLQVRSAGADCAFLGGIYDNDGGALIKHKLEILGDNERVKLLAPDGFGGYPELLGLPAAAGAYVTSTGRPMAALTADAGTPARFLDDYRARHGHYPGSVRALYGVQALQVILAAIARSDGTRQGVRDQVFSGGGISIGADEAILGRPVAIDPSTGDTRDGDISINRITTNSEVFVKALAV